MPPKTFPSYPEPGVVVIPSRSRLDLKHRVCVEGLTCTCERTNISRMWERWRCHHKAQAITQGNIVPLPTGNWIELNDEQIQLLDSLAEEQKADRK